VPDTLVSVTRSAGLHREVVAIFPTEKSFSDAIDVLQSSGVDRARISVLATGTPEAGSTLRAAGFSTVEDLLDAHGVPRSVYVQPEDVGSVKGMVVSGLVYVGATVGAGLAAVATGAVLLAMIAAAAASGAAGGSLGAFLTRRLGAERAGYIEQSLAHGGLILWVVVADSEDEARIVALLKAGGGHDVHARALTD
jgi:hypothetical protein